MNTQEIKYYRLVAEEGKYLTNGVFKVKSVDTTEPNMWREVEGEILPKVPDPVEIIEDGEDSIEE